jgi:lysophospholipase L1-like esterase
VIRKLSVGILSAALAVVAVEAVLRWSPTFNPHPTFMFEGTRPRSETSNYVPDEVIGWRMRSNLRTRRLSTTAQGFRGTRDVDAAARPIAVVGDSFTFGSDVSDEENYPARLQQQLGDRAPVANLAIEGFSLTQVWLTARHKALLLKPRLLIVGVIEVDFERSQKGYDTGKNFRRPWFRLVNGSLIPMTQADQPHYIIRQLDARSRLWRLSEMVMQGVGHHLPVGEWWTLNAALLSEIHRLAREANVPVLFVNLPTIEWRAFPTLQAHMTALGAHYIDLAALPKPDVSSHFLSSNRHPSIVGHQFIADQIMAWIDRHPEMTR